MGSPVQLQCLCHKTIEATTAGEFYKPATGGVVKAKLSCNGASVKAGLVASASIAAPAIPRRGMSATLTATAEASSSLSAEITLKANATAEGNIDSGLTVTYALNQKLTAEGDLDPGYVDKIAGNFNINFHRGSWTTQELEDLQEKHGYDPRVAGCTQNLYPIDDLDVLDFRGGVTLSSGNLYDQIDEGVFTKDYYKNGGSGQLVSDDINSYIQPHSDHTEGTFTFKCEITRPITTIKDTRLRFRAAAPLANREAKIAPEYTIQNIRFEDPSGGLIAKYQDIKILGDAAYRVNPVVNFTTYSSAPETNYGALYGWEDNYPVMGEASGYTLSFDIKAVDRSDAFNPGFDLGFEENYIISEDSISGNNYLALAAAPLATVSDSSMDLNVLHSIRISAIEICNNGNLGPAVENYLGVYTEVEPTGRRLERKISPISMPVYGFDDGVYPTVSSIWYGSGDPSISNETKQGAARNVELLNNDHPGHYITLDSTGPVADSGKLILEFGHQAVGSMFDVTRGAFNYAFDQAPGCHNVSGAYNTLNKNSFDSPDHFFVVDCVFLRVLAKKAVGSRNYAIDVVGYSDDKILNVTRKIGGFLQNTSGDGSIPVTSGFNSVDDLGISSETLSDADQYYEASGTNNAGGDHYLLSPEVVTTTEFKWHEIPLQVYEDTVTLGKSKDYTMSSNFEHLYLDIFPLPSGASIGEVELVVRYRPQSGLNLSTQGGESLETLAAGRSESKIYPISRQSSDDIINAGSGYAPLSKIEGIPQSYGTPTTIKSNYSRRWRGHTGLANGPFDPDMFGFGYENPLLDSPFVSGYFDFTDGQGTDIIPRQGTLTGVLSSTYSDYRFKNLGWRFTDNTLFTDQLPGYTGDYQTIDWTSLVNGGDNFESHPLYGQIADAFDTTVRISGHNSYINFGDVDVQDEFSLYTRFSPDANVSGVGYDLFESGVLVSKWDSGNDLEFALGYSGGYLRGIAKDTGGGTHEVIDTAHYTSYQYPLSVILTYNDHYSSGLKLYTDNEFENDWTTLRASSVADFDLATGNSNLVVGNSTGSGVGFNMFLCEFGLSNSGNVVYENADLTFKEVTAQRFLENARVKWWDASDAYTDDSYKLWDYVNEDSVTDWHLGDFKYAEFNQAFDRWTKRTGRDLISFNIDHHGSGYSQTTDITLPTNVDNDLAYHTQIENDFLRFNLSEAVDTFYSTNRRITKDLPRGYKFSEEALVVDTIIQHNGFESIVWEDGTVGPKLIVSLYTKNQDPYWVSDEPNWGLINRDHHYLTPSSYMTKLKSVFDYDSLIDESEEWAKFPTEPREKEFKEKYFSQDINDMFVQYDVAYPSGSPFESRIDIHTTHIRLEDAYVTGVNISGSMDLVSSGGYPVAEYMNLSTNSVLGFASGEFNLYTFGVVPTLVENSGLSMFTSGMLLSAEDLSLFTQGHLTASNSGSGLNISISGSPEASIIGSSGSFNLNTFGKGIITSSGDGHLGMALTAINTDTSYIPSGSPLSLFTYGSSGNDAVFAAMPMFTVVDSSYGSNQDRNTVKPSGSLSLQMIASQALFSRFPNGSMNLFTFSNQPTGSLNLTLYGDNYPAQTLSEQINLFTANYDVLGTGSDYVRWFNLNYGTNIDLEDNHYATVPVSDNIRGVDIVGYGSCDSDSPEKAVDPAIITHDTTWREETCNDGGIFRATDTYTSGSWSGNYYDIRKYTGLVPNATYNAELKISTGSTEPIKLPREWEETEYGTNSDINFSGAKLVGDNPYFAESGRIAGDHYGKAVSVKGELMAVGAPGQEVPDESGVALNSAGATYLYRRNTDVAGEKAAWAAEQKLMLPSGFRGDYAVQVNGAIVEYDGIGAISGHKWHIGQEGREFGHSVDIATSGEREVVVVGAPGAQWSREFIDIETSGVSVAMMIFVDRFEAPDEDEMKYLHQAFNKFDILYKYFSAPLSIDGLGNRTQPELDMKIIIYHCLPADSPKSAIPSTNESWIQHVVVNPLNDPTYRNSGDYLYNSMLSGVKDKFLEEFPHDTSKVHNNIPPIVGIFQDSSISLNGARNTNATERVVDAFEEFYKDYSYASGVIDLSDLTADSGYVNRSTGTSQRWATDSTELLNDTLSTGNLDSNDALDFITSGIGMEYAMPGAFEFQIFPGSGGRAYIFEKENGAFNLIQEIKSAKDIATDNYSLGSYGLQENNRFGHSVSISDNTEVVTIGSPFSNDACNIYERSKTEEDRLFNGLGGWLQYRGLNTEYQDLLSQTDIHGAASGQKVVYQALSEYNKFYFRSDEGYWNKNPPSIYRNIYTYGYDNIARTGTWDFIPKAFASTSRLGYSTAISEDGTLAAFGAPTDSFNEFEDTNVWYNDKTKKSTWASYTNAGAVRMFESRRYYPHNLAVEFYRFGNLDKNSHPDVDGYDDMGQILSDMNVDVSFRRMDFEENNIPQEAGLAFIITPELDAASDEVIDNIKDWLALGNRTLVLVGNDPEFEENGKYKESNEIVNKVLKKLDSRMRIHAAKNEYESINYCADTVNAKYNVTKAKRPSYSHSTTTYNGNIYASGVGDIRIDLEGLDINLPNLFIQSPCDDLNSKCEMPLKQHGDLRSQWRKKCYTKDGYEVIYDVNWPFHFGNFTPACNVPKGSSLIRDILNIAINRPNQEPTPILTAAEWLPPSSRMVEYNDTVLLGCIQHTQNITGGYTRYEYADNQIDNLEFSLSGIDSTEVDGVNVVSHELVTGEKTAFFNPPAEYGRDGFLQGVGESYDLPPVPKKNKLSDHAVLVSEEDYGATSKVILVASLLPENDTSMNGEDPYYEDSGKVSLNNDENLLFYKNILTVPDCATTATVKQLGGWTGRTSFIDAYSKSELKRKIGIMNGLLHPVNLEENYTGSLTVNDDILWIANPAGKPSQAEADQIKDWLNEGNKKVVITYDYTLVSVKNVLDICDKLDLNSKPFVDWAGEPIQQSAEVVSAANLGAYTQELDASSIIIAGCDNEDKVSKIVVAGIAERREYFPIDVKSNTKKIVYYNDPVNETRLETPTAWKLDGASNTVFDVSPGSGYRLFYNYVSEGPVEEVQMEVTIDGPQDYPSPDYNTYGSVRSRLIEKTPFGTVKSESKDFRVPSGVYTIGLRFNSINSGRISSDKPKPYTPRILSVSGCLLPINETVTTYENEVDTYKECFYEDVSGVIEVTTPEIIRPIMTDNTEYCLGYPKHEVFCPKRGGKLIEDGPVVVAEEFEHFSAFSNGSERSRIVVISDSTIVQGQCPTYRDDSVAGNQAFIKSLYPSQPQSSSQNTAGGREYEFVQKLMSPERGSPAKYFAASGLGGLVDNFGLAGVAGGLSNYDDDENLYKPDDVDRPVDPDNGKKIQAAIKNFRTDIVPQFGIFPRFSGVIGGSTHVDAGILGGVPTVINDFGKDYLDFDFMPSGYLGDLFGYSVSLHKDKLVVGSPFNAFVGEEPISWSGIVDAYNADDLGSGLELSNNGGAGAAFYFERTEKGQNAVSERLPWEYKEKIKPSSINVGIDNATLSDATDLFGDSVASLDTNLVLSHTPTTDQFGYSVSVDADFVAIGAPGHDMGTLHHHIYSGSAAFIRKDFNAKFDIPQHSFYDLGSSGVRIDQFNNASGTYVMNNGAVFTYEHSITDWPNRTKEWRYKDKVVPQGYNARKQTSPSLPSGSENDAFGRSVHIDRARRGDSDYTLVAGAPKHKYGLAGGPSGDVGAAYTYDLMLREQIPAIPNSGSWIDTRVVTEGESPLVLKVYQNTSGPSIEYSISGLISSNSNGDIFLEASGYDPATRGFVAHRPYVTSVIAELIPGIETTAYMSLLTSGKPVTVDSSQSGEFPSGMNLFINGPDSAFVYNNMGLYTSSWNTIEESGLALHSIGTSGIDSSGSMFLYTSGIGIVNSSGINEYNPLNLRIRGY